MSFQWFSSNETHWFFTTDLPNFTHVIQFYHIALDSSNVHALLFCTSAQAIVSVLISFHSPNLVNLLILSSLVQIPVCLLSQLL